ncbi:phage tail protein [Hyalangium sp.]|uniref:phage tail protein n=1 Tax=Hyalangium sp. TaxID=2028555 RepID=UPI002D67A348|nr:tail fiber protein [Hyalangium sp.]HYI01268.1 tail fiber protein [Hyalangium sp.]
MSEPFLGEIRLFGGNFAPRGWALCDGQILPIAQNTALFSILGTTYGGNGQTTFALPDLRGRAPLNWGTGPGLTPRSLGEASGVESVTLISSQMPAHNHAIEASTNQGDQFSPAGNVPAVLINQSGQPENLYSPTPNSAMAPTSLSIAGGSQPHQNMQPFLCVSFIIALEGIFPSRS